MDEKYCIYLFLLTSFSILHPNNNDDSETTLHGLYMTCDATPKSGRPIAAAVGDGGIRTGSESSGVCTNITGHTLDVCLYSICLVTPSPRHTLETSLERCGIRLLACAQVPAPIIVHTSVSYVMHDLGQMSPRILSRIDMTHCVGCR